MAKRGPKGPRYDEADQPYRRRALELINQGQTPWAAAKAVVDARMVGIGGDYAKAKRLHEWLMDTLKKKKIPVKVALLIESGRTLRTSIIALGQELSAIRQRSRN